MHNQQHRPPTEEEEDAAHPPPVGNASGMSPCQKRRDNDDGCGGPCASAGDRSQPGTADDQTDAVGTGRKAAATSPSDEAEVAELRAAVARQRLEKEKLSREVHRMIREKNAANEIFSETIARYERDLARLERKHRSVSPGSCRTPMDSKKGAFRFVSSWIMATGGPASSVSRHMAVPSSLHNDDNNIEQPAGRPPAGLQLPLELKDNRFVETDDMGGHITSSSCFQQPQEDTSSKAIGDGHHPRKHPHPRSTFWRSIVGGIRPYDMSSRSAGGPSRLPPDPKELLDAWGRVFRSWDRYRSSRHIRRLLEKGVPYQIRGTLWKKAVGDRLLITPALYEATVHRVHILRNYLLRTSSRYRTRLEETFGAGALKEEETSPSDSTATGAETGRPTPCDLCSTLWTPATVSAFEIISADVRRTLPRLGVLWQSPNGTTSGTAADTEPGVQPIPGVQDGGQELYCQLRLLLESFVLLRPDVGYVQGMGYLAAMLLLYIRDDFDAFACFANLMCRDSLRAFYTFNLPVIEAYFRVFDILLRERLPRVAMQLDEAQIPYSQFLIDWMYTVFTRCLPLDVASRVWDMFLVEGDTALFQVSLALLHHLESEAAVTTEQLSSLLSASSTNHFGSFQGSRFLDDAGAFAVPKERLDRLLRPTSSQCQTFLKDEPSPADTQEPLLLELQSRRDAEETAAAAPSATPHPDDVTATATAAAATSIQPSVPAESNGSPTSQVPLEPVASSMGVQEAVGTAPPLQQHHPMVVPLDSDRSSEYRTCPRPSSEEEGSIASAGDGSTKRVSGRRKLLRLFQSATKGF